MSEFSVEFCEFGLEILGRVRIVHKDNIVTLFAELYRSAMSDRAHMRKLQGTYLLAP